VKVLALGAHPDDLEIFMFGTMAAYATQGAELIFAIATDGAKGGKGAPGTLVRARREEARAAAALLGVTPHFLGFPAGELVADSALNDDLKAKAIRAHQSQDPERFVDAARVQNAFRAGQCNGAAGSFAEAFRFEPVFPFADIRALLPPAPPIRTVMVSTQTVT